MARFSFPRLETVFFVIHLVIEGPISLVFMLFPRKMFPWLFDFAARMWLAHAGILLFGTYIPVFLCLTGSITETWARRATIIQCLLYHIIVAGLAQFLWAIMDPVGWRDYVTLHPDIASQLNSGLILHLIIAFLGVVVLIRASSPELSMFPFEQKRWM